MGNSTNRIKYQEIVDACHNQGMTDDDINNLPDDDIDELNAVGNWFEGLSEIAKRVFSPEYEEEKTKRERCLANYLANHTREENIEMMVKAFHEYYDKK